MRPETFSISVNTRRVNAAFSLKASRYIASSTQSPQVEDSRIGAMSQSVPKSGVFFGIVPIKQAIPQSRLAFRRKAVLKLGMVAESSYVGNRVS